jgi:hypothetical protein
MPSMKYKGPDAFSDATWPANIRMSSFKNNHGDH